MDEKYPVPEPTFKKRQTGLEVQEGQDVRVERGLRDVEVAAAHRGVVVGRGLACTDEELPPIYGAEGRLDASVSQASTLLEVVDQVIVRRAREAVLVNPEEDGHEAGHFGLEDQRYPDVAWRSRQALLHAAAL